MGIPCRAIRDARRSAAGDRQRVQVAEEVEDDRAAVWRHVQRHPRSLVRRETERAWRGGNGRACARVLRSEERWERSGAGEKRSERQDQNIAGEHERPPRVLSFPWSTGRGVPAGDNVVAGQPASQFAFYCAVSVPRRPWVSPFGPEVK